MTDRQVTTGGRLEELGEPAWVRDEHAGPFRPGWWHCTCDPTGHGGHRDYFLECCRVHVVPGCVEARPPEPCGNPRGGR